jgi:catechol 2,3-dioxygenase
MQDRLGAVRYRTPALEPMIGFYRDVLGFALRSQTAERAVLGTPTRDLVILDHLAGARKVGRATGLYHTAFLVPSHRDLVHLLGRIAVTQTPVEGFNHHGTHEAIYLPDPDGNGVELAWDLPQDQWPRTSTGYDFLAHDKQFDPQAVLEEFQADHEPWTGLPDGARVGHVHLHVADLKATRDFYQTMLEFQVMFSWEENGALFLATDEYHHHVGANLWKGKNLPPAPNDAQGLVEYTWRLEANRVPVWRARLEAAGHHTDDRPQGFAFRDPSGIGIAIESI